jgi:hypothetical protein
MGWYQNSKDSKHKVFVSYYHAEDQYYRDEFDKRFNHLFISKSVEPGDIDSDSSDEYIIKPFPLIATFGFLPRSQAGAWERDKN